MARSVSWQDGATSPRPFIGVGQLWRSHVGDRANHFPTLRDGPRQQPLAGQAVLCRNPDEARRRAEKGLAGGRIAGAHIVRVLEDAAAGDYGEPEYLAEFGRVPDAA